MAAKEVWSLLQRLQDNMLCPICLEMVGSPSCTPCGHTFCQDCIEHVISSTRRPKCPICKKKVTKRSLRGDPYLERIVDAVKTLEGAIVMDTGMDVESLNLVQQQRQVATGTPGILLHQRLHPSPRKC